MEKSIVYSLLNKYGKTMNEIPKTSKEDAEEIYFYFEDFSEKIQRDLYNEFCKDSGKNPEFNFYLQNLFHETNSHAGNFLNRLRNFYYAENSKADNVVEELRHKLFHEWNQFILLLLSMEYFYNSYYKNYERRIKHVSNRKFN